MINTHSFIFKKTPLDIFLGLFLISQILSTIFSIDPHTSLWGYYSRSNGGLLSIVAYILLYYAIVSNFDFGQIKRFLYATLAGGAITALWAIPEHFGHSMSCLILTGQFDDSCWVQDVQSRVFATLGQPNWLAAYMEMLIFPALYFAFTAKSKLLSVSYFLLAIIYYMAFTFTYSRGATLGLIGGLAVFGGAIAWGQWQVKKAQRDFNLIKLTVVAFLIFLLVNFLYGSAFTRFQLFSQSGQANTETASVGTQLENGGTESGEIRLIVWKGALEIFKHYPILGSGVETFAYSYYNFRPVEHNLVSEWDFLYNKAHNEYLNYLATTGAVGFLTYMSFICYFLYWSIKKLLKGAKNDQDLLFIAAILGSYISYLVQDFFGFSVVAVAVLFFVFPVYSFLASGEIKAWSIKTKFFNQLFKKTLYRRPIYEMASKVLLICIAIIMIYTLRNYWIADTNYKTGTDESDAGNVGKAYNLLINAVSSNPGEPLYHSELGYAAAASAVASVDSDATESAFLKQRAIDETQISLMQSPKNVGLWRTAIRTYYELSILDPTYDQKTLDTFDKTISLAPTDPKLEYNKALILEQLGKIDEALVADRKAVDLKPNYPDAIFKLGELYQEKGDATNAKTEFENVLKLIPNQPDAVKKLDELNSKK